MNTHTDPKDITVDENTDTTAQPDDQVQAAHEEQAPEQTPEPEEERPGRGNAEAAERRRELRAVQAERDALRDHVASLQRAEVERLAAGTLAVPADLWDVARVDLAELLGPDGQLDTDAAAAAIAAVVLERPGLQAGAEVPIHLRSSWGHGYSGVRPTTDADWGRVLRGQ